MDLRTKYNMNKNRSIYFQLGVAISLLAALLIINTAFDVQALDSNETIDNWPMDIIQLVHSPVLKTKEIKIINKKKFEKIELFDQNKIIEEVINLAKPYHINRGVLLSDVFNKIEIPGIKLSKPKKRNTENKVFDIVEQMPLFGDCEGIEKEEAKKCSDKAIQEYFSKSVRYPALAREIGIQGRVFVEFIIDENGAVTSPKLLRDIGGGCGDEVLRVIKKMPDWHAGYQHFRHVKVKMRVPISFKLNN